jgi:hypothetical protein
MTIDATKSKLIDSAMQFRKWAEEFPEKEIWTEWETAYEKWPELTRAFSDFLN